MLRPVRQRGVSTAQLGDGVLDALLQVETGILHLLHLRDEEVAGTLLRLEVHGKAHVLVAIGRVHVGAVETVIGHHLDLVEMIEALVFAKGRLEAGVEHLLGRVLAPHLQLDIGILELHCRRGNLAEAGERRVADAAVLVGGGIPQVDEAHTVEYLDELIVAVHGVVERLHALAHHDAAVGGRKIGVGVGGRPLVAREQMAGVRLERGMLGQQQIGQHCHLVHVVTPLVDDVVDALHSLLGHFRIGSHRDGVGTAGHHHGGLVIKAVVLGIAHGAHHERIGGMAMRKHVGVVEALRRPVEARAGFGLEVRLGGAVDIVDQVVAVHVGDDAARIADVAKQHVEHAAVDVAERSVLLVGDAATDDDGGGAQRQCLSINLDRGAELGVLDKAVGDLSDLGCRNGAVRLGPLRCEVLEGFFERLECRLTSLAAYFIITEQSRISQSCIVPSLGGVGRRIPDHRLAALSPDVVAVRVDEIRGVGAVLDEELVEAVLYLVEHTVHPRVHKR